MVNRGHLIRSSVGARGAWTLDPLSQLWIRGQVRSWRSLLPVHLRFCIGSCNHRRYGASKEKGILQARVLLLEFNRLVLELALDLAAAIGKSGRMRLINLNPTFADTSAVTARLDV